MSLNDTESNAHNSVVVGQIKETWKQNDRDYCERLGHSLKDNRQTVPKDKFYNNNSGRKFPVKCK